VNREAGIFHFRKGEMPRAEKLLREAMRIDPRDYMATFFYARYLDETGNTTQAIANYKEVLRYVPDDPDVHEAYARCFGKMGKNLEAYIHLTYSALYANNRRLTGQYFAKAKALAEKATDKRGFERLEAACKERREIWEKD
jgi:tetratricopeptide (TPR) repeat protein